MCSISNTSDHTLAPAIHYYHYQQGDTLSHTHTHTAVDIECMHWEGIEHHWEMVLAYYKSWTDFWFLVWPLASKLDFALGFEMF
jgi:hypothetical protein